MQLLEALLDLRRAVRAVQMASSSLVAQACALPGEAGTRLRLAAQQLSTLAYADTTPEEGSNGQAWQEPILAAVTAIFGGRIE